MMFNPETVVVEMMIDAALLSECTLLFVDDAQNPTIVAVSIRDEPIVEVICDILSEKFGEAIDLVEIDDTIGDVRLKMEELGCSVGAGTFVGKHLGEIDLYVYTGLAAKRAFAMYSQIVAPQIRG